MSRLRVLAVDDEALALRRIELLLGRMADVELVGVARNVRDALVSAAALKPDVMLLDIRLGVGDGFEVITALDADAPVVIFVTAYDEFATRAFQVSAVDYVVKPVEFDRLAAAIEKARNAIAAADAEQRVAELRAVVAALRAERAAASRREEGEIWAQHRGRFVRVPADTIEWIEAERDYVHLHAGSASYLLRETVTALHERLGTDQFLRIRRSALVQLASVAAVRKAGYGDVRVLLKSGTELRVGRTYVRAVRDMIGGRSRPADDADTKDAG